METIFTVGLLACHITEMSGVLISIFTYNYRLVCPKYNLSAGVI